MVILALGLAVACNGQAEKEVTTPPLATVTVPETGPTAQAEQGPLLRLTNASIPGQNQSATVSLVVEDFVAAAGLGGYDVRIEFDPRDLRVDGVSGGDGLFSAQPQGLRIDNSAGVVQIATFHTQIPGPRGTFTLARLQVTARGSLAAPSGLQLTVNGLFDSSGQPAIARIASGTVTIGGGR